MRPGVFFLAILCLACDTMIADRLIIKVPEGLPQNVSVEQAAATVRDTLLSCGFKRSTNPGDSELWIWHDPDHPPDIHADVAVSWKRVNVHLVQGLYGPTGPTAKYRETKASLMRKVTDRYGKGSVELE